MHAGGNQPVCDRQALPRRGDGARHLRGYSRPRSVRHLAASGGPTRGTRRMKQSIYFASACGKIKIGCSVDPERRILSVGEWVPYPTTLLATMPGTYALEASLHRMFDEEWSHGEWFDASPRLLAFINTVIAGNPVAIEAGPENTRRNAFIAEKKRVSHQIRRLAKAGLSLPESLGSQLRAVPKGQPIPRALLDRVSAAIDALVACAA